MIDLILVDDDPILLDGLERSFPWHDMQYRIVGTARNGREALQLIERRHPQVLAQFFHVFLSLLD